MIRVILLLLLLIAGYATYIYFKLANLAKAQGLQEAQRRHGY